MPMRNSMRLSAPTRVFRSGIACCTATAQRTASTTLANSTSRPSPVILTMRPLCSAIFGSRSSWRNALRRSSVPSSSAPISREYPATSAARIAASRRVWLISSAGSGDGDRAAVRPGGAFDRRRGEDEHKLVLAVGDQIVEDQILVVEDAVLGLQFRMARKGQALVRVRRDFDRPAVGTGQAEVLIDDPAGDF